MRISDWSSDVCSSDLPLPLRGRRRRPGAGRTRAPRRHAGRSRGIVRSECAAGAAGMNAMIDAPALPLDRLGRPLRDLRLSVIEACNFRCGYCMPADKVRSEEHTSELQSLMRISYAVFCLKKKKQTVQS